MNGGRDAPDPRSPSAAPSANGAIPRDEAVAFLGDLVAALHVAYAPADRIQARVAAAARGLGFELDAFTLQSLVLLQRRGAGAAHLLRAEFSPHYDLDRLQQLGALTESVAAGRLSLPAARAELERVVAAPDRYPRAVTVLGFAAYSAGVAGKVGGGLLEILAAAIVGALVGAIYFGVLPSPAGDLQKGFVAAFVASASALLLGLVLPPFDMSRAVFGATAFLVPAMVVTLAVHELASETAVESGVIRLFFGLLRFMTIGAGLVAVSKLWAFVAPPPPQVQVEHLPTLAIGVGLAVGALGLHACMQARPAEAPWVVAAVLFAWGVQELTKHASGGSGSPLLSALALAIAGNLYGLLPGKLPTTVIYPGLLQLVPGFLGTQAILTSLRPDAVASPATFFEVGIVSIQLVLGVLVGEFVYRGLRRGKRAATG